MSSIDRYDFETSYVDPLYEHLDEFLTGSFTAQTIKNVHTDVSIINVENEKLILRTPGADRRYESYEEALDSYAGRIEGLRRGLGADSLEQMVYFNPGTKQVVTKHAPGHNLIDLPIESVSGITHDQYANLFSVIENMKTRKIMPDTGSASNLVYDPAEGFTVIDYAAIEPDEPWVVASTRLVPAMALWQIVDHWTGEPKAKDHRAAWLASFVKGREVLLKQFPDVFDDAPKPLQSIEGFIRKAEQHLS